MQELNEFLTVKRVDENSEHKEKDPDGPYKLPGSDQLTKYVPADLQHSISQWDYVIDLDREVRPHNQKRSALEVGKASQR